MTSNKPTTEAFLTTVKKSGLAEPERLQKAQDEFHKAGGNAEDSIALAEYFVAHNVLTKWQAEKLLQGKHKGYFLGKYRLLSLLGKGGMSSVFLAEHILMRRRCAIKVLPTKRVADSSYLARFHREAQAVAALDHPNIVRAYDVDHQTDREAEIHFLVMEYVEGESLQELVANSGPCAFTDAVDYIRQAALGLEHAHQAGMVHRDIKPGNLLVDPNGTVKLLDLGLARYFSSEEEGTALTIAHDEKVLGTADYLAPEQALDSHTVDHRADLYSLGCTLYFLLTGHPPFTEGTLAQRLMAHQTKEPPPVEKDRPETPASLAALLRKMMSKKPEDRQATASDVAVDMLHWLSEHADTAWKQAHSQLFGGLRGSDTNLGLESPTSPAKAIPVAQQIVLTISNPADDPDTQIVPRGAWPTGDLKTTKATTDSEPELSAFLAQVEAMPTARDSSPKAGTATKSAGGKSLTTKAPVPSGATNAATKVRPKSTQPAQPKAAVKPDVNKNVPAPPPTKPTTTPVAAFPSFDFAINPPAPPPPVVAPIPVEAAEEPAGEASRPTRPPMAVMIAAAVVGIALLGIVGAYSLGWFNTGPGDSLPPPPERVPRGPLTVRSLQVYGEDADYQSLKQALDDAHQYFQPKPAGTDGKPDVLTIKVASGTHDEQLHIDGGRRKMPWPDGIVVRGEGEVVFKSNRDGPVVSLREVTGLTIENLTIDAGDKPVGVMLSGFVTGTRLSNLRIRNFSEAGLALTGSQAFGAPLVVENVRCETKADAAVGIRLEPNTQDGKTDDTNNVAITRCRLNGPMSAGISVSGSFPYKVSIRESIFVKTPIGVRFQGAGRWQDFALANNSFFQCPIGIAFTAMPSASTGGLMIRRNLFVGSTTAEALVQAGYDEPTFTAMLPDPAAMEWNWSDRAAPATPAAGEINLFGVNGKRGETGFAFDTVDPKSAKFLLPSAASPQKSAPSPRENEQPWVGALGPATP